MLGIGFFKAEPTEYARMSVNGKVKKKGEGVSTFYLPHRTSIELAGTTIVEKPLNFREVTIDNQDVSLQGGLLYRISDPEKVFTVYNFAIDPRTKDYLTEEPMKLEERLQQVIRVNARRIVQQTKLEPLLTMGDDLSLKVIEGISGSKTFESLGLEFGMMYFSSIVAQPEIAKALGAKYREELLQKASDAEYKRRAAAVQSEREIKENELKNEIELETQRKILVEKAGQNRIEEAKYEADASKLGIAVFDSLDAEKLRAHALYQLGMKASQIGNLTITPEILAGLNSHRS